MRPSLRFLALAVVGWGGFRAATLGALPGGDFFALRGADAKPPAIVPTSFPQVEPIEPATAMAVGPQAAAVAPAAPEATQQPPLAAVSAAPARYVHADVGVPVAMRPGVVTVYQLPPARPAAASLPPMRTAAFAAALPGYTPAEYAFLPPLGSGYFTAMPGSAGPVSHPAGSVSGESVPALDRRHVDRLQLTSWALLRSQQMGIAGSRSLAPGGQLGASQAGARLLYNINRQIAAAARLSSPVGTRGGEAAAGVRIQPLVHIPLWLTAERRQEIGRFGGGRNAFALLVEGGVYEQPLPWRFTLDSYFQGGVVGLRQRELFFDGGLAVTRPLWRNFSAGFGVWGGAQPHLGRLDVGPRLTMRVRQNVKVHFDWRQKLAGNARPGSGPALTLAGDF